jgi:hypothetical protein
MAESERPAPFMFVRRRPAGATTTQDYFQQYWKSKATGNEVEVLKVYRVDGIRIQIIFHDQEVDKAHGKLIEMSVPLDKMIQDYEPVGNLSTKY